MLSKYSQKMQSRWAVYFSRPDLDSKDDNHGCYSNRLQVLLRPDEAFQQIILYAVPLCRNQDVCYTMLCTYRQCKLASPATKHAASIGPDQCRILQITGYCGLSWALDILLCCTNNAASSRKWLVCDIEGFHAIRKDCWEANSTANNLCNAHQQDCSTSCFLDNRSACLKANPKFEFKLSC